MRTIAGAVLGLGLLAGGAAHAQGFTLSSPAVTEGGTLQAENIYNSFGCTGNDISPALNWTGAPAGTKSYAVTLYDPDAPTGSGFWHWSMFDIPATASGVVKDAGNPAPISRRRAASRSATTTARSATAAPARQRATSRTTTSSRSSRWTLRRSDPRPTPRRRWSASTSITTRSRRQR